MHNNDFQNLIEKQLVDMNNMCNLLNKLGTSCNRMYEEYVDIDDEMALKWKKYATDLFDCKITYNLYIIKLRSFSEGFLDEKYKNDLAISKSISDLNYEMNKLISEYPDIFD